MRFVNLFLEAFFSSFGIGAALLTLLLLVLLAVKLAGVWP